MSAVAPAVWRRHKGRRAATLAPASPRTTAVTTTLTVIAVVLVWFLVEVFALSGLTEARAQDRLHADFREQLAAVTAPTGGVIPVGAPVALLRFPDLGVEQVVAEGTLPGVLLHGPGHRRDTVLPGQAGVSVVYGKSATFGRPFAPLLDGMAGKSLIVITAQGTSSYRLGPVRRPGDPIPAAPGDKESRLVLVTARSSHLGRVAPDEVVYIDAISKAPAFTAPGGRMNTIGAAEAPMASDTTALPSLAFFLGLLVVATVGAMWAKPRFGVSRTWLVFIPVLLATAWKCTELIMELVPNLV